MKHDATLQAPSAKVFPFAGSQKPINIARIRPKQQQEVHKADAVTLHAYLGMPFQRHTHTHTHRVFRYSHLVCSVGIMTQILS